MDGSSSPRSRTSPLELPGLLTRIRESGGQVSDLDVHPPSLHSVFIHLTGRELRE